MKNKVLTVLIGLTLTLSMVFGILAGCTAPATPKPTTPGATTKAPTTTAPGATTKAPTTSAPTPTKAGEVFNLSCQCAFASSSTDYWLYEELFENIKTVTGGRVVIKLFPVGAILAQTEVLDGVQRGAVDAGIGGDTFWAGKNKLFDLQAEYPGGFTPLVQLCWWYYHSPKDPVGPGRKFSDDLFGQYNCVAFPLDMAMPEAEYVAQKPLIKPSDWKGTTFRGTGIGLDVISDPEFGAKPVFIASTDVYTALQTGVVDAAELGGPWGNLIGGYMDICKYTGFPGMHNLGEVKHLFINKDPWNKLSKADQKAVEMCCVNYSTKRIAYQTVENARIIPTLIDKGVTIIYQSPETQKMWQDISFKVCERFGAKDPVFADEFHQMKEFQFMLDRYIDLQTPDYGPDYPGNKETYKGIKFQ